jgi:hypothetical protein
MKTPNIDIRMYHWSLNIINPDHPPSLNGPCTGQDNKNNRYQ